MKKRIALLSLAFLLLWGFALPALGTVEADGLLPTPPPQAGAPVEIRTPEGLAGIAKNPYGDYVLAADIDMKGVGWTPFAFYGSLDGAGHTVYNLRVDRVGEEREISVDGNRLEYDTVFAGLFSLLVGARVRDLSLMNVTVSADTVENCFAAGLAGFARGVTIDGIHVSGRVRLTMASRMGGVGGIVGFGDGTIHNSSSDVELVFLDTNRRVKCEQFLGGIAACGYLDMLDCQVKLEGYASVHGYAHSGGLLGMYHVHDKAERKVHQGYVRGCTVDGHIRFFENNKDRRAYCRRFVGEPLDRNLVIEDNVYTRFIRDERDNYRVDLLPEMCAEPVYDAAVTPPALGAFGFTVYTCRTCGYIYSDDFTAPLAE